MLSRMDILVARLTVSNMEAGALALMQ